MNMLVVLWMQLHEHVVKPYQVDVEGGEVVGKLKMIMLNIDRNPIRRFYHTGFSTVVKGRYLWDSEQKHGFHIHKPHPEAYLKQNNERKEGPLKLSHHIHDFKRDKKEKGVTDDFIGVLKLATECVSDEKYMRQIQLVSNYCGEMRFDFTQKVHEVYRMARANELSYEKQRRIELAYESLISQPMAVPKMPGSAYA
jgi:hypothetical protein